jgi:hypothetical protein
VVLAAACTAAPSPDHSVPVSPLTIEPTDSPYVRVTAGAVSGLVPSAWSAIGFDGPRQGFLASPQPTAWTAGDLPVRGISAIWVDAAAVGVASDYYYLAATGPIIERLSSTPGCRTLHEEVVADHVPAFLDGDLASPGDFVALGDGVCRSHRHAPTRWSYFVAAPGFGPATALGIPGSGLYVVAALTPAVPGSRARLDHLLGHVRFGQTRIGDFVKAAGQPVAAG